MREAFTARYPRFDERLGRLGSICKEDPRETLSQTTAIGSVSRWAGKMSQAAACSMRKFLLHVCCIIASRQSDSRCAILYITLYRGIMWHTVVSSEDLTHVVLDDS